jgi:raffinose/stachyose/melibiose transport system permease protein
MFMLKVKSLKQLPAGLFAVLVSLTMSVPVYLIFVNSLKTSVQSSAMGVELPTSIHFENYLTVIEQGKLGTAFINSTLWSNNSCCPFFNIGRFCPFTQSIQT